MKISYSNSIDLKLLLGEIKSISTIKDDKVSYEAFRIYELKAILESHINFPNNISNQSKNSIIEKTIKRVAIIGFDDEKFKYMCDETGVGSGQVYNEFDLHLDKNKADKQAKEKHKEGMKQLARNNFSKKFNGSKEIVRLDFKSSAIKDEIAELLKSCSGVINGLPYKVQVSLGIDSDSISKLSTPLAVVDMKASKESKTAMHDLNALAMTGLLSLHVEGQTKDIVDPPFLPIAGINFGHKVATDLLAVLLKVRESSKSYFHTTYLLESTEEVFNAFWPRNLRGDRTKFLHNGLYPCYSLYKTSDGKYVALAAVEEKFWLEFCEVFNLDIPKEDRFSYQDDKVFDAISKCFLSRTQKDVKKATERHDFCLSLI